MISFKLEVGVKMCFLTHVFPQKGVTLDALFTCIFLLLEWVGGLINSTDLEFHDIGLIIAMKCLNKGKPIYNKHMFKSDNWTHFDIINV